MAGGSGFSFSFSPAAKTPPGGKVTRSPRSPGEASEGEGDREDPPGADDGIYFEPAVPLPDKVQVTTGEEEEEVLFEERAKLFRFDAECQPPQWKERGLGQLKLLRHPDTRRVRLLMRREQVLKVCANHYLTPDLQLKVKEGSDTAWVWTAMDSATEDGQPRAQMLCAKFKRAETALCFQDLFEASCQEMEDLEKAGKLKTSTLASNSPPQSTESETQKKT